MEREEISIEKRIQAQERHTQERTGSEENPMERFFSTCPLCKIIAVCFVGSNPSVQVGWLGDEKSRRKLINFNNGIRLLKLEPKLEPLRVVSRGLINTKY